MIHTRTILVVLFAWGADHLGEPQDANTQSPRGVCPLRGARSNIVFILTDDQSVVLMTDTGATHLSGKLNGQRVRHFNMNMMNGKNSANERGTHVPAFFRWNGVLVEDIDMNALSANVNIYAATTEIAGVTLPDQMQPREGLSLVPLFADAKAPWPDRELFVHSGRSANGDFLSTAYPPTDCVPRGSLPTIDKERTT
jgi:hypothetical protein